MHAWLADKIHMCTWHLRESSKLGETCKHALPLNVFLTSRIAKTKKLMLLCWQVVDIRDIRYIWYKRYQLPRWLRGKESACWCTRCKRCGFDPWVGKIPWNRKRQPTPIFLPGNFYGQRSWRAAVHGVPKSWTWLSIVRQRVSGTFGVGDGNNIKLDNASSCTTIYIIKGFQPVHSKWMNFIV